MKFLEQSRYTTDVSPYIFPTTKYRLFERRFHNHRSSSHLHWMIKGKLGQESNLKKELHVQIFHRPIQGKNQ